MMDSVIQFEGTIYEDGYGLLAQKVMRDKSLPKQSKLIYAYMCSFAGVSKNGERTAFPSVSLQCAELGMSEDTYYKWRKPLIDKGYIKIKKQRKEGAKFDNNLYSIIAVPVEIKTTESVDMKEDQPTPKKSGMVPYPKKSGTVNPSTENQGTNSNSSNSNNLKEEEEEIKLTDVILFMNEQIQKREITNQKTITAIMEVAVKCKAIGTQNKESMENYCIKVVEDKMSKFGQKQKTTAGTKQRKLIRKELEPDWLDEDDSSSEEKTVPNEEMEQKKKKVQEILKKYKAN